MLRDDYEPTLLMGLTPTQSLQSPPLRRWVSPSTGEDSEPILLIGLTLTQIPKEYVIPQIGLTPTRRRLRTHSAAGISPHSESLIRHTANGSPFTWILLRTDSADGSHPTQSFTISVAPLMGIIST